MNFSEFDAPLNVVRNTNVRRVFFLRLGAVGDLLVATAALSETLERFPNAEVWVAGPALWTELLFPEVWPRVTGIFVLSSKNATTGDLWIPDGPSRWSVGKRQQTLAEIAKHCDASVNLRLESTRFAAPLAEARLSVRLGTGPWWSQWYLTHWSPWLGRDPILHERDRLLHIVRAPRRKWWPPTTAAQNRKHLCFIQTDGFRTGNKADKLKVQQPGEAVTSVVHAWHDKVLPSLKKPDPNVATELTRSLPKQYLLINPTASRREKAWPATKFAELCSRLKPWLKTAGLELVLIGAPDETVWLNEVNAAAQAPLVQPANLSVAMDVIGQARGLVTNTSSLQFIANSLRTPAFVLMGRTYPARWGPLGPMDRTVCGTLPKPPMKNIFLEDFAAYDSLQVDAVLAEVQDWLQSLPH